jgi:FKBP-type peptidyl-prolyl cis-trans isomerase 2
MARPLLHDDRGVSTFWSFVGVLVLVAAILGVYYGYVAPRFGTPPIHALAGDSVQVDYVGTFEDTGFVFDTSLESVARDNATYPKAVSFTFRSQWSTYNFRLGDPTDAQRPVPGFERGIYNMAVGETRTIVVPPELGYGPSDAALIQVKPIAESVPVRLTMNETEFLIRYQTQAVSGINVTDPFWKWSAFVSVAGGIVTVTNSPYPGQLLRPYGLWDAQVVSIDDGANDGEGLILVRHLLDPSMARRIGEKSSDGQVTFILSDVDLEAGTYTLDANREVVGRTLLFTVTMVNIGRLF